MTAKLYKGLFWIKQEEQGRFIPITVKIECDADGNAVNNRIAPDKDNFNHEEEWKIFEAMPSGEYRGMKYDHYPRGRVEIKNKKANIYLPSVLCIEYVKRLILHEFGLTKNYIEKEFITFGSEQVKKNSINLKSVIEENKNCTFEDVLAMFPEETEKSRIIDNFIEHLKKALEFIKTTEAFKTVDIQRYLRCGYGDTCRVLDTLVLFGVIEEDTDEYIPGGKYKASHLEETVNTGSSRSCKKQYG